MSDYDFVNTSKLKLNTDAKIKKFVYIIYI